LDFDLPLLAYPRLGVTITNRDDDSRQPSTATTSLPFNNPTIDRADRKPIIGETETDDDVDARPIDDKIRRPNARPPRSIVAVAHVDAM
jgi:hypothetical protein